MNRFFTYIFDKTYTYSVQMETSACFEYLNEKCTAKDKEQKEVKRLTFVRYPFKVLDSNRRIFKIGTGSLGQGAVLKGQIEKNNEGSKVEVKIMPRSWVMPVILFPCFAIMGLMASIEFFILSFLVIIIAVVWNWFKGRMYLKLMDKIVAQLGTKD